MVIYRLGLEWKILYKQLALCGLFLPGTPGTPDVKYVGQPTWVYEGVQIKNVYHTLANYVQDERMCIVSFACRHSYLMHLHAWIIGKVFKGEDENNSHPQD